MKRILAAFAVITLLSPALSPGLRAQPAEVLSDPAAQGMEKVKGKFSETWVHPEADFTQYNKLMPGGAQFEFRDVGPAKKYRSSAYSSSRKQEFGILPEDQEKFEQVVGDAFQKEMERSKKFTMVEEPGPGTLIIEGAVLDIVSHVPPEMLGRNEVYVSNIATATLVLELLDSETGQVVAYVEERRKITPPGGNRIDSFSMPTNSVTVWSDVGRWARGAASRLRSALEKAQKG